MLARSEAFVLAGLADEMHPRLSKSIDQRLGAKRASDGACVDGIGRLFRSCSRSGRHLHDPQGAFVSR